MNHSAVSLLPVAVTVVRWAARTLSVVILLFWGYFLIAHLLGEEGRSSRPLAMSDYVGLTAMVVSLVGLMVALKWELTGGVMTLTAVLIGAVVNWRVLWFPGILIPIAAVLFLACWWMSRARRETTPEKVQ
jgi:hypothetical protein